MTRRRDANRAADPREADPSNMEQSQ
jgi:hypothetical protein